MAGGASAPPDTQLTSVGASPGATEEVACGRASSAGPGSMASHLALPLPAGISRPILSTLSEQGAVVEPLCTSLHTTHRCTNPLVHVVLSTHLPAFQLKQTAFFAGGAAGAAANAGGTAGGGVAGTWFSLWRPPRRDFF